MATQVHETEAIVLRTLKYGESDVIAHLFTREVGRRNVIAKGARKSKSRLGARLEPFLVARLQLREGRGDLAIVQSVEVVGSYEHVRETYSLQQVGAVALDMLNRLSVEHVANESAFHLTTNLLRLLDEASPDERSAAALLTGYELKLLHLTGFAPHLGSCARCGSDGPLVAWSGRDGGVVCTSCRQAADTPLDADAYEAAAHAMRTPLAELPDAEMDVAHFHAARRRFVDSMCSEHAGFRPRQP